MDDCIYLRLSNVTRAANIKTFNFKLRKYLKINFDIFSFISIDIVGNPFISQKHKLKRR